MKKSILSLILLALVGVCFSQSEDCRTKVKYNGYFNNAYSITIANKMECPATYEAIDPGGMRVVSDTIQPNCSKVVLLPCHLACGTIKVKPLNDCAHTTCDMGYVYTQNVCNPLAVKISYQAVKMKGDQLEVTFKLSEATNARTITFNTTTDGITYVKRYAKAIADLRPGIMYTVTFKY